MAYLSLRGTALSLPAMPAGRVPDAPGQRGTNIPAHCALRRAVQIAAFSNASGPRPAVCCASVAKKSMCSRDRPPLFASAPRPRYVSLSENESGQVTNRKIPPSGSVVSMSIIIKNAKRSFPLPTPCQNQTPREEKCHAFFLCPGLSFLMLLARRRRRRPCKNGFSRVVSKRVKVAEWRGMCCVVWLC